jgi:TetR/AcrR family acrAB operon transcriptional repressor
VKQETSQNGKPRLGGTKALATRAALIELAAELFSEEGYIQTSIRDIAQRAELTTGAIYGHFRGKADLLAEAISKRTADELEAQSIGIAHPDYVKTLTRLSYQYPTRRRLRSLLVQGAAASLTDPDTREQLRKEQLSHLRVWIDGYQRTREQQRIDPGVDVETVVLYSWAAELGLGVLEAFGIAPRSRKAWADMANRFARGLRLPPDTGT